MPKVMIVDDEAIFREFLRNAVDWEACGFELAGEAKHGQEALELAERTRPDLALVDINMPFMDGLQLTEELKRRNRGIHVVMVTGHNEFEYARRALKLGVEDYILKPFSKEELLLTLLKLHDSITREHQERSTYAGNLELMKEAALNRLLLPESGHAGEESLNRLTQLGLLPQGRTQRAVCIELDALDPRKGRQGADKRLWRFAVTNVLLEAMEQSAPWAVFHGPEGRIVCLLNGESLEREGFERLLYLIRKYLRLTVTVGIGTAHEGLSGVAVSYQEALEALQHKFVLGNDRLIPYEELRRPGRNGSGGSTSPAGEGILTAERQDRLRLALRSQDPNQVRQQLAEAFGLIRSRRLSLDYIYVACMGLISLCLSHVTDSGHPMEDCFGEDFVPYQEIRRKETAEAAFLWIEDLYAKALSYTGRHKHTRSRRLAEQAKGYIERSYADPELAVEQVAQHVFMNPGYLRAVFKKETGMTVTDYIMFTRMQKAKELLRTGGRKLADVAERTGYNDAGYFSKCFKKYYGLSPSEYENAHSS